MRKIKANMTTLIGLALLGAAVALSAWPENNGGPGKSLDRAQNIRTALVEQSEGTRTIRFAGVTRPADRATIAFAVPGRLASRPVAVGDRARKGATLAVLDNREMNNALTAATAALAELDSRLAQAERDRARVGRLSDAKAATAEELEHAQAAVDSIRAARESLVAQRDEATRLLQEITLTAPFDATVTRVYLEPGEWAAPGLPVVEVSGERGVEIEVELPESVVIGVREGMNVSVELPHLGNRRVIGRVTSLARVAPGAGRLFPAVIQLDGDDPAIRAGLTAEPIFEVEQPSEIVVPLRAVLNPGSSSPFVFQARDGRAHRSPVTLGEIRGDSVVVRGEIQAGEAVIVAGHTLLTDGDAVEELQ